MSERRGRRRTSATTGSSRAVLAQIVRGAALPCAGDVLLRAQRRREACDPALAFAQGRGPAADVRVPRHLAPLQGANEERRAERRDRHVLIPHDHAEFARRGDQSRTDAGVAYARARRGYVARPIKPSRSHARDGTARTDQVLFPELALPLAANLPRCPCCGAKSKQRSRRKVKGTITLQFMTQYN